MVDVDRINKLISEIDCLNTDALEELFKLEKNYVYAVASRYVDRNTADDILQETFLKIVKSSTSFRGGNGHVWIMRICRNISLDYIKKNKKQIYTPDEDLDKFISPFETENTTSNKLFINNALKKLSELEYIVLTMLHYEGFTFTEVSKLVKKKQDTVYKIYNRTISKLQNYLMQEYLKK